LFSGEISQRVSDALNETVGKVTRDIENLRFNTAISQLMICLNAFTKEGAISKEHAVKFLQLLSPFAPHIAEEIYSRMDGASGSISFLPWPKQGRGVDPGNVAKLAVQINGKTRGECHADRDASGDQIIEIIKNDGKLAKFLAGKNIVKTILVPAKIINIVVE
jgi:leucyl-tRNA synthetase